MKVIMQLNFTKTKFHITLYCSNIIYTTKFGWHRFNTEEQTSNSNNTIDEHL